MRIAIPVAAGLIAIVAVILAAVALAEDGGSSSGPEPQMTDLERQLQEMQDSLTSVQLVAALDALDGTGVHHFDEDTIKATSREDVPAGYLADVRKIRRVVNAVSWPEEVQDEAQTILDRAEALEAALTGDDLKEIKTASPPFHAAWHALREVGYRALAGEGPGMEEQHGG